MTCLLRGSIALGRFAVRLATIDAARTMLDALATMAAFAIVLAVVARLV